MENVGDLQMRCSNCGKDNIEKAKFCAACGAPLAKKKGKKGLAIFGTFLLMFVIVGICMILFAPDKEDAKNETGLVDDVGGLRYQNNYMKCGYNFEYEVKDDTYKIKKVDALWNVLDEWTIGGDDYFWINSIFETKDCVLVGVCSYGYNDAPAIVSISKDTGKQKLLLDSSYENYEKYIQFCKIEGNLLYYTICDSDYFEDYCVHQLYVLNLKTGETNQVYEQEAEGLMPVFYDNYIYYINQNQELCRRTKSLYEDDEQVMCEFPEDTYIYDSNRYDHYVYSIPESSRKPIIFQVDLEKGIVNELKMETDNWTEDHYLMIVSIDNEGIYYLDTEEGESLWKYDLKKKRSIKIKLPDKMEYGDDYSLYNNYSFGMGNENGIVAIPVLNSEGIVSDVWITVPHGEKLFKVEELEDELYEKMAEEKFDSCHAFVDNQNRLTIQCENTSTGSKFVYRIPLSRRGNIKRYLKEYFG